MQRYILFVLFLCLQWVAQAQTDYEYRYWFDKDDANAQTGTFAPGTLHLDVDLSTLDASLHTIHIQVKNGEGEWSSPVTKYFARKATSLTPLVYWLDNQVTPLELSSQSGHFDLDVSALDDGIHLLRLQLSQTAEGSSSPVSKFFFKMPLAKRTSLLSWYDSDHENIKKLEYDGGKPFLLDVSEIEDGFHVLYLQAMGQGGLSMPTTKMFIKVPQTEGVSSLTCVCSIDGKLYKTEQVSSEGGIVNWNFDVASLSQGIHSMQIQVLTPTGAATNVSNHFFFRTITQQELNNMKLVYSLDGNEFHTATGDAANGVFHFDVDVASLEDGLHRIVYSLASDNGTSTKVSTSFFWKTPIGGNGIMEYRYWLNDNEADARVKVLDNRVSPFSLVTLLPVESLPIRSSCFQFEVKDGVPMMYAKNDFHIAFYDASYRRVDETKQFVDYNVSQKVEDIADLQSTQTFTRPGANAVKWFSFEGEKGDTVAFRSSQAMSMQVYAPSGKEIYATSADKSVKFDGCHTWEDGTYYVAVHDVTGTRQTVTLDFMHMDRYDVVAQDVHTVGNGGCSTIIFQGNGFRDLYAVELYTANGDTIHSIDIGHESDASTTATFDFTDAELGKYDALFHFTEESKTFTSILSVEEARDIELATKVSYPSTFLRGSSVTYSVEIANKGNMTAYMVPLEIKLVVDDIKNVHHIKYDGYLKSLSMPKISDFDNLDSEDIEEIKQIIENSSDLCQFIIYHDTIQVHDYGLSQIIMTLPPNSTQSFTINIKSETNVHIEAWTTSNWFPLSCINSTIRKVQSMRAPSRESMCCMKDKFECGAEIVANIVGPFMPPGAGCLSSLSLTGLETAYDVWCSDGNSVSERWNNYLKSEGNSLANRLIQSAVTCITGYYGARLKSLRKDRNMAARLGSTTEVNRINAEIAACRTAKNSAVKSIYDGITTMILGGSCYKAWTETKPNCPPNPEGGGGSSSPVVSYDPNDIYGYTSESGSRYISDLIQNVNYRIEFENDTAFATASASAHVVEIKDTLDSKLFDLATFVPTDIKIGNKTEHLDGTPNFVQTIDMRPAINTITQVEGKFDRKKGIATWTFTSLDPMTMEPTDDVMQGFLPVNHDGISGIGEVSYNISLKGKLTDGKEIPNRASIVFDNNEPILTPTWTNVIDAVSPESYINYLEVVNDSIVRVHCDGEDSRSGIWKYSIYVQYGENASWNEVAEIDTTCFDFRFYEDIEYGFCVIATDSAGNVEQKLIERQFSFRNGEVVDYTDAVKSAEPTASTTVFRAYDLNGRLVQDENQRGIIIKNRKKLLRR